MAAMGMGGMRSGSTPLDPYANMPQPQPIDNSWYQDALRQQEELARQQAAQQAAFARQQQQQFAAFAQQYQRMNQQRLNQAQPRQRVSRMYMLGGY